jgi:formylglycine-generating enzyme required for sulfatase activity
MYELLALRPAFGEKDRNKLIKHVTSGEPTPLHKINRETPRDLVTIIHKAIDRDPGRRYATAEDMAADLQRFLEDEPILARRQTQLERYWRWARHNPGLAVLGGVLTAVLVIATLASLIVAGRMSALADNAKEQEGIAHEQRQAAEESAKEAKAYGLVQLVLNVDTPKVPPIIEQMTEYRQWTDPKLREVSDRSPQRLHASLALLPADPGQVDYLFGRLLEADPRDVFPVIRDALAPHKDRLLDRLWAAVEKPEPGKESQRLWAAAALAKYDPESKRWANGQGETSDFLTTLQEKTVRVQGLFRKDGTTNEGTPMVVEGVRRPHWLFTHPTAIERVATVSYDFDRPYTQFLATVGIPALRADQQGPRSPLTFEIIGNGKSIWKSSPLTKRGDIQPCQVSLAGINQLELRVSSAGPNDWAWAVWMEPRLTRDQTVQDVVVNNLVAVQAADLTAWKDALRPVRAKLLAPLSVVFRNSDRPAERSLAADILADYAADQPRLLADLLLDADEKQFAVIYPKLKEHGEQGVPILTGELGKEMSTPPAPPDWTVRFYKWHDVDKDHPANWEAVLKSPILDVLRMPRLYLVGAQSLTPAPPTPKVPRFNFAVVATTEVTLGEEEFTIRATVDDGVRVWLDNNVVIDDWVWGPPRTKSAVIANKPGRHVIKVEFFQAAGGYTLDVDLTGSVPTPEKLTKRQVNAAVALLQMDQPSKVWPLLKHSPDPRLRSYLIHALAPLGADAKTIVKQLNRESEDVTMRRALLLSLSEFGEKVTTDERKAFLPNLQKMYQAEPDPGLHAATEWLLRQWKEEAWLAETNQAWAEDKEQQAKRLETIEQELKKETGKDEARWYVNGQGQTLVVIPGPVEFWMGSPPTEEGRGGDWELRHWRRIGRSFAIASKEVTVEQFLRFRKDHPISRQYAPSDDCPVNNVTWYEVAEYCNWLSEQEGIPKEQWCYEPNAEGKYAKGMKMAPNYYQRTGYRLPTEAEWEFACRAGAATRYFFGESEELLPRYAWYQQNSQGKSWPVGSLKPNDLGLFDMHGNIWQWCQDAERPYDKGDDGKAGEASEDIGEIPNSIPRMVRGGVYFLPALAERSANRADLKPEQRFVASLRPARTLPFSSFDYYAAARAAALAAAGKDKDKPPLDDTANAKLRRQAHDWLKAQLSSWSKVQPPRLFIARNLWQWQQESDMAGIRDQAALAKLPPDEQKAFTQFWADVEKLAEPANSTERLEFARVAVLIAGQDKDEPPFDAAAKAKLRGQALDWLKAELTVSADRAVKARIIAAAAVLAGMVEKLAESAPNDGPFQAELARYYAEHGNNQLAGAAFTKARALFEANLAKEPVNEAQARELADLLLIDTNHWTVLKPVEAKSELGATLSILPDDSILASGPNPLNDRYRVELTIGKDIDLTAVRLEALTHPSLPGNGPGRTPTGSFAQTLWKVTATSPDRKDPINLEFRNVWGDHQIPGFPMTPGGHWNIAQGGEGRNGTAVWSMPKPVSLAAGTTLTFEMQFKEWNRQGENLGRFRLSVSADPAALDREKTHFAALKLTDPWLRLMAAYARIGRSDTALEYLGKALQADPKLADDREAQYRYHAARAAVLAAAGQGRDEPPLADDAKAKLRRQALEWLKAELTVWTKQLDEMEAAKRAEYVWIEDDIPPGAKSFLEFPGKGNRLNQPWTWVTPPKHPVFSGSRSFMLTADGLGQQFFEAAPVGLRVGAGDTLFAYVYLDPARLPKEIMLQWNTGDWGHRVSWGDSVIHWENPLRMGRLPEAGKWTRLEVEAAKVGIKPGMVISGWAFTQHAGTVYWDKAGIVTKTPQGEQKSGAPQNRILIALALASWQNCSDLAGIREKDALAKLPAEEQKEFAQLWADVAELSKKAEESADNAERLAVAQIAYNRKQFATSTREWAKALAKDPTLGDDRKVQHRYNAACAAALAAAGQALDEPPLDDAEKAKLRGQALDWLTTEMKAWDKLFASGTPQDRPFIVQTLKHWQQDSDLAGIRDPAALAKLPAGEQKAFTQLWAELAALLKKVESSLPRPGFGVPGDRPVVGS